MAIARDPRGRRNTRAVTSTATLRASSPGLAEQHARVAVGALFLTNGALFANLLPRYPQIKVDLGISNVAYGLAVAAFPAGAMVAGLASGTLIRRFGSAPIAVTGTIATSVLVLIAGTAPVLAVFVAALFVAGAMDAITDVAQNAHGLEVQRRYGRSIINSFHATWSIGAVLGGSMAAGAIALGLPRGVHLAISAVLFSGIAHIALRFCLPHAPTTSSIEGEVDHHDRVLLHDADQQHDADQRHHVQFGAAEQQAPAAPRRRPRAASRES